MKTISICLIVRDEEEVIGRCLESVRPIADEIVVVDTGSTDKTKEICRTFTEKIFDFAWRDDFAAARNESFSHATKDYILWLDADDVIEPEDRKIFLDLKQSLRSEDVVMCRYHTAFGEDGRPVFSFFRERILRREAGFRWEGRVHECIQPRGRILYSEAAVCHRKLRPSAPGRNLRIYQKMREDGEPFSPRHRFYFGRELADNGYFEEAERELRAFLDGGDGWFVNCVDACRMRANCLRGLGRNREILPALFESFAHDLPHAEVCCDIGAEFLARQETRIAVRWFEEALRCNPCPEQGGFYMPDCYHFIPLLQLCVCYDRLGDRARAAEYNRAAAIYHPNHPSVLKNFQYFGEKQPKQTT